jgi:hypothetical protein
MLAVVLVGCESGTAAPPAPVTSSITLTPSRTAVSTPRGWNALVDIGVTRTGGFTDAVALSVEGVPPGVIATFSTPSVPALGTSGRLNIDVDNSAAIGTYPLTIRGLGKGVSPATTTVSLVVPQPTFLLELASPVLSSSGAVGLTSRIDVTVARDNGFRGPVVVEAQGLPTGVTGPGALTIAENSNRTSVFLVIGASATVGSYPVTIRATSAETEPRTASVNIVIPAR